MPKQSRAEYRELRASIATHGYYDVEPIVVWILERKVWILDGRHRAQAAREVVGAFIGEKADAELEEDLAKLGEDLSVHDVEPTWIVFDGAADQALDLVEVANLRGRRSFASSDAKALAAMGLYKLRLRDGRGNDQHEQAEETEQTEPFQLTSPAHAKAGKTETKATKRIRDEIAEQIGVSPTDVARARYVETHAVAELGEERAGEINEAVKAGTLKLSRAEKEIKQAKTERERNEAREKLIAERQVDLVDDRSTILIADVVDALRGLADNSVNVAIADPPYNLSHGGTTIDNREIASVNKGDWDRFETPAEFAKWCRTWIAELERVLAPGGQLFVTGTRHAHPTIGVLLQGSSLTVESDIVWHKANASPRLTPGLQDDHELIWWAWKAKRRFRAGDHKGATWKGPAVNKGEMRLGRHVCQKPRWLIDAMLDLVDAGPADTILDLFAGSGTTTEAAIAQGARAIAIDSDPACETVIRARAIAAAQVPSVPTGTDGGSDWSDDEDLIALAYVLETVGAVPPAEPGGQRLRGVPRDRLWARVVAKIDEIEVKTDAEIHKVATAAAGAATTRAIDDAGSRGLIEWNDERAVVTVAGIKVLEIIGEQLGTTAPAADERQSALTEVGQSVARYFFPPPGSDMKPHLIIDGDDENRVDGLICGIEGITGDATLLEGNDDPSSAAFEQGRALGRWIAQTSEHAPLIYLGLICSFSPSQHSEKKLGEQWDKHCETIECKNPRNLPLQLDGENNVELALLFAVHWFEVWAGSNNMPAAMRTRHADWIDLAAEIGAAFHTSVFDLELDEKVAAEFDEADLLACSGWTEHKRPDRYPQNPGLVEGPYEIDGNTWRFLGANQARSWEVARAWLALRGISVRPYAEIDPRKRDKPTKLGQDAWSRMVLDDGEDLEDIGDAWPEVEEDAGGCTFVGVTLRFDAHYTMPCLACGDEQEVVDLVHGVTNWNPRALLCHACLPSPDPRRKGLAKKAAKKAPKKAPKKAAPKKAANKAKASATASVST